MDVLTVEFLLIAAGVWAGLIAFGITKVVGMWVLMALSGEL